MIDIRPISDLRNNFTEIEQAVREEGPVYLTKHGYGSMVVLSIEDYSRLVDPTEIALDQADYLASNDPRRMTHDEVFGKLKESLDVK